MDSLFCPRGKKALSFSLNQTRFIWTPNNSNNLLCPWEKKALRYGPFGFNPDNFANINFDKLNENE